MSHDVSWTDSKLNFLLHLQVGRRKCVGEDFGKAMVLALISAFVTKYEFALETPYDFSKEPPLAFTRAPNSFVLILKLRDPWNIHNLDSISDQN